MHNEYSYESKAMGTDVTISLISENQERADAYALQAQRIIGEYENRFSRFLPESELSMLNVQKKAIVSPEFLAVITEAYELFKTTRGVFNPLLQIERLGYTKNFEDLHDTEEQALYEEPYDIDFSSVHIETSSSTVSLQPGQKLDVGGFLKGYLATRLCKELAGRDGISGAIVNIGGDLHAEGVDAQGNIFECAIYNPLTNAAAVTISMGNKALATSGTYKRTWKLNGKTVSHILDITGTHNPDTNIISASVIHEDGGHAEAFAKVFISLGEKAACELLRQEHFRYVLIASDGTIINNIL